MWKKVCGPMKPLSWLAIGVIIAIISATSAKADSHALFDVERLGQASEQSVIFIPGLATPGEVWNETAEALGNAADMHLISVAGFGGVPAAGEGDFIAPLVNALTDYIDSHDLDNVTLVGHSLGAQIALQLAVARPGKVTDVVVVDSAPFFAALFNPAVTPDQAAQYGQGIAMQMAAMPHEQFMAMSQQGLAVQSISEHGQMKILGWMEASDQYVVARAMGEVAGGDFRSVLSEVKAEVTILIAWAAPSPVSADQLLAIYRGQYAGLEHSSVQVVRDSRHFIMLDQPDVFMEHLQTRLIIEE